MDQIKVMMNKTTPAGANTHERFGTSSSLYLTAEGRLSGDLKRIPCPDPRGLLLLAVADLRGSGYLLPQARTSTLTSEA